MRRLIALVIIMMFMCSTSIVYAEEPSGWASEAIAQLDELGIIFDGKLTSYAKTITRAEYGYLIFQLYEYLTGEPLAYRAMLTDTKPFTDTLDPLLYSLKAAGLVKGYPDGSYGPDDPISRQEIMVLYVRLFELLGYELIPSDQVFADEADISQWARDSVKKSYEVGFIKGLGDGIINPKGWATVQESLVVMNRIIGHEMTNITKPMSPSYASSIMTDGKKTFMMKYDIFGYPIAIELYDDFELITSIYEGEIKDSGLYLEDGILYFFSREGQLVSYNGLVNFGDSYDIDGPWYTEGGIPMVYDESQSSEHSFKVVDGILFNDGEQIATNVVYMASYKSLCIFIDDQQRVYKYDHRLEQMIAYSIDDVVGVDIQGNFAIIKRQMIGEDIYHQYVPLVDMESFLK